MPKLETERSKSVWRGAWIVLIVVLGFADIFIDTASSMGYAPGYASDAVMLVMWGLFAYMPLPLIRTGNARVFWVCMCGLSAIIMLMPSVFSVFRF